MTRVGEASRRRIAAGGKLALGRPSTTRRGMAEFRVALWGRARGRCECCGRVLSFWSAEVEHAVNRSQGSADSLEACWASCHECNQRKTWAYDRGRLVVIILGGGRFRWELHFAADKWATRTIVFLKESA